MVTQATQPTQGRVAQISVIDAFDMYGRTVQFYVCFRLRHAMFRAQFTESVLLSFKYSKYNKNSFNKK